MIVGTAIRNRGLLATPDSTALSAESRQLSKRLYDLRQRFAESISIGFAIEGVVSSINALRTEAADVDWDGYGARPVDPFACAQAIRFVKLLPTTLPVPEVAPDPDGEVSLDWYRGPYRQFSVSVNGRGRLAWAGMFGPISRDTGREILGREVPKRIIEDLSRLY